MKKRGLFILFLVLLLLYSIVNSAYQGTLDSDTHGVGILPTDAAYHELIHITNGSTYNDAGTLKYYSIDANMDGRIDMAERTVDGLYGNGSNNALIKFNGTKQRVINSSVYEVNGNVGIGISTPSDRLQLLGGHIWNLGQNDAGLILRSGDEGSNGINIVTSSDGDLRIQARYKNKNYDVLFMNGSTRNVGIGITNPLRALDIRSDEGIHLEPSKLPKSPFAGDIVIDDKDSNKLKWYDGSEWLTMSAPTSIDSEDGAPADVVYIDSIGNVGIGTTDPSTQLEINGDAQINGMLIMQSDINMSLNRITDIAAPINDNDAATKKFVTDYVAAAAGGGPVWAGYTSPVNGERGGIKGMNQECENSFSGSHACLYEEIIKLGADYPWSQTAWVIDGLIPLTEEWTITRDGKERRTTYSNSDYWTKTCHGWTVDGYAWTSEGGPVITTDGYQDIKKCTLTFPIPCCK